MDTSEVWTDTVTGGRGHGFAVGRRLIWDIAPPTTLDEQPRSVYVIGPAGGPYKVGMSCDTTIRCRQLSTRRRERLQVWGELHVKDARAVEKTAHGILFGKRLGNEWFDCTLAEAVEAVTKAADIVEHTED